MLLSVENGLRPAVAVQQVVAHPDRIEADLLGGTSNRRQLRPAHDALDLRELNADLQRTGHDADSAMRLPGNEIMARESPLRIGAARDRR